MWAETHYDVEFIYIDFSNPMCLILLFFTCDIQILNHFLFKFFSWVVGCLVFSNGIPETIKQFLREYWWSRSISPFSTSLHNRELVFVATVNVDSRFSTFPSSVQTLFSSLVIWFFRASITDVSWLFSSCCLDGDDAVPCLVLVLLLFKILLVLIDFNNWEFYSNVIDRYGFIKIDIWLWCLLSTKWLLIP